jgi:hypothetical protein
MFIAARKEEAANKKQYYRFHKVGIKINQLQLIKAQLNIPFLEMFLMFFQL